MDLDNTSTRRCKPTTTKICILVLVTILVAAIVIITFHFNGKDNSEHENGQRQRITRQAPFNAYRISQNNGANVCSIEISSSSEPFDCPQIRHDKHIFTDSNGERYLDYRGKRYSFLEIQAWFKQAKENKDTRIDRIRCCYLSYVANLMGLCPGSKYDCYKDDTTDDYNLTPRCGPPKIKMDCKCYQSQFPLCEEENLPWCHSHTNGEECRHKTETDDGAQLRCICNTTREAAPESTQCSKLSTAVEINVHRISLDSPNKVCSIDIPSPKEPRHCGNKKKGIRIHKNRNGEAYVRYRKKNYYYEDIEAHIKQPKEISGSRRNRLSCCFLTYMANFMKMCPGSEYACYTDDTADSYTPTPRCGPPTVKLGCKCYQSQVPICVEDKLPWCHSNTNSEECRHETVTDDGVQLRCICNTTLEMVPESAPCSKLSAIVVKNDEYIDYRRHK